MMFCSDVAFFLCQNDFAQSKNPTAWLEQHGSSDKRITLEDVQDVLDNKTPGTPLSGQFGKVH